MFRITLTAIILCAASQVYGQGYYGQVYYGHPYYCPPVCQPVYQSYPQTVRQPARTVIEGQRRRKPSKIPTKVLHADERRTDFRVNIKIGGPVINVPVIDGYLPYVHVRRNKGKVYRYDLDYSDGKRSKWKSEDAGRVIVYSEAKPEPEEANQYWATIPNTDAKKAIKKTKPKPTDAPLPEDAPSSLTGPLRTKTEVPREIPEPLPVASDGELDKDEQIRLLQEEIKGLKAKFDKLDEVNRELERPSQIP